jgi:hypothetical protein
VASAIIVGGITVTTFTLSQGLPSYIRLQSNGSYLAPCVTNIASSTVGRSAQHLISSVIFAGLTAGMVALVKANGKQLCSRPRLCGLI